MKPNDPRGIIIPFSEICELIQNNDKEKHPRVINLCYWFSWLLYYERLYYKGKCLIEPRHFTYLDAKYTNHWIVILLEIIIHYSQQYPHLIKKCIFNLVHSYCILYGPKNKKTFASLILMTFKLLINPYNLPTIDQDLFQKAYAYSLQCNFHYMNNSYE
jgi:hypothetical protein